MSQQSRKALWLLISGFTWWLLAFGGLYALQALGCRYEWTHHRIILMGATAIVLMPMIWLAFASPNGRRGHDGTLLHAALWANRAALVAAVFVFTPVVFATACV